MGARISVGLDIGSSFTKIALVDKRVKRTVSLLAFPTPWKPAGKDSKPQINGEALSKQIAQILSPEELKRARFFITIPATAVNTLLVLLPVTSKKDVNAPLSVARQTMIPATESYHVLQSVFIADWMVRDVMKAFFLVTRVDKRDIDGMLAMMQSFHGQPEALVPAGYSLPGLIGDEVWKKQEDIAFVDIGATTMNIVIGQNKVVSFNRTVAYGLHDIFSDLSQKIGLPREKIEPSIMNEWGVPKVDFDLNNKVALSEEIMRQKYETEQREGQVNMLELRMLWQAHLDRIVQEIRRSLIYYKEQSGGRRVWRIYFSGGGSAIKNLIGAMAVSLGGECRVLEPGEYGKALMGSLKFPGTPASAAYADVLGLVLKIEEGKQRTTNFIPPELHARRIGRFIDFIAFYALLVVCVVVGALLVGVFIDNQRLTGLLKESENALVQVQQKQSGLKNFAQGEEQLRQRENLMRPKIQRRKNYPNTLLSIVSALPADIVLNNIEFSTNTVRISGLIKKDYESASRVLGQFKSRLDELKIFKSLDVPPLALERIEYGQGTDSPDQITRETLREFTLTAVIKDPEVEAR